MLSAKKKLLIANWKLNHSRESAREFFLAFKKDFRPVPSLKLAVAPVTPMLEWVKQWCNGDIELAAQNVFYEKKGAFTGEWNAFHLKEIGVRWCIVGHSERRALFFETDEMVAKKALACVEAGIIPIICVGETRKERDAAQTLSVITRQVEDVLSLLKEASDVVFAYEPVWAIGSNEIPTAKTISVVHEQIRSLVEPKNIPCQILYGGSVSPQNIKEIVSIPIVDGALVGGASLQASSFLSMVEELRFV